VRTSLVVQMHSGGEICLNRLQVPKAFSLHSAFCGVLSVGLSVPNRDCSGICMSNSDKERMKLKIEFSR